MSPVSNTSRRTTSSQQQTKNYAAMVPPQALELERTVLGALLLEKDAFAITQQYLRPNFFYLDSHKHIYQAMINLAVRQEPIDYYSVIEELKKAPEKENLDAIGGPGALAELTQNVSSAANLEYHAKIVMQKYLARELISAATKIQTMAFNEQVDIDDLMTEAQGLIFDISQSNIKKDVVQINPVVKEAIEKIQIASKRDDGLSGLASGFTELDKITSGWHESDLVIIAARPAMGKTAFVLSMAKAMAVEYKTPIAVFSLEMSNVQLVNRLLINTCEIEGEKIKNGKLSNEEWMRLYEKSGLLQDAPLYIDDTPSLSVSELQSKARRLVNEHGVKMIIIDYLQLMNANGMKFGSREQEVSIISRSLKTLAKDLNIPVIALSQLNRGVEGRTGEGKKPQLSDLRESGAIEQDADMVCFIHRPEYYGIHEDAQGRNTDGLAEIIIAKHRSGATGEIYLKFEKDFVKFKNLSDNDSLQSHSQFTEVESRINANNIDYESAFNNNGGDLTIPDSLTSDLDETNPF